MRGRHHHWRGEGRGHCDHGQGLGRGHGDCGGDLVLDDVLIFDTGDRAGALILDRERDITSVIDDAGGLVDLIDGDLYLARDSDPQDPVHTITVEVDHATGSFDLIDVSSA